MMVSEAVEAISIGADGVRWPIPSSAAIEEDFDRIAREAEEWKALGREVVVVQGLGFVGAAVAAVVAGASDAAGNPRYFVVGVDLATPGSYWKIAVINDGRSPIVSPDVELERLIAAGVGERRNLKATGSQRAYSIADYVIVDVPLDVIDRTTETAQDIDLNMRAFEGAVRAVGREMKPDALVIVETTVPIGACEKVVAPILNEERTRRGIETPLALAHAYERVMPGPRYVDSIRAFWRTFSAIDGATAIRTRAFLESFMNVEAHPLAELQQFAESEMAKLLENSYRAVNIAFIDEWTAFAERAGIDLFAVVDAIRLRKGTHDNMRFPGFGVGGYCLTKDSLLAQWAATNLYGGDVVLPMTLRAIATNYRMPLRALDMARELNGGDLQGLRLGVCGVSYLPELSDTRNSPAETFVDAAIAAGAQVSVHDPFVRHWFEKPDMEVSNDFEAFLSRVDAIVFTLRHNEYLRIDAAQLAGKRFVVDGFNVIADDKAKALRDLGVRIAGVGKGHWRRAGYER